MVEVGADGNPAAGGPQGDVPGEGLEGAPVEGREGPGVTDFDPAEADHAAGGQLGQGAQGVGAAHRVGAAALGVEVERGAVGVVDAHRALDLAGVGDGPGDDALQEVLRGVVDRAAGGEVVEVHVGHRTHIKGGHPLLDLPHQADRVGAGLAAAEGGRGRAAGRFGPRAGRRGGGGAGAGEQQANLFEGGREGRQPDRLGHFDGQRVVAQRRPVGADDQRARRVEQAVAFEQVGAEVAVQVDEGDVGGFFAAELAAARANAREEQLEGVQRAPVQARVAETKGRLGGHQGLSPESSGLGLPIGPSVGAARQEHGSGHRPARRVGCRGSVPCALRGDGGACMPGSHRIRAVHAPTVPQIIQA